MYIIICKMVGQISKSNFLQFYITIHDVKIICDRHIIIGHNDLHTQTSILNHCRLQTKMRTFFCISFCFSTIQFFSSIDHPLLSVQKRGINITVNHEVRVKKKDPRTKYNRGEKLIDWYDVARLPLWGEYRGYKG